MAECLGALAALSGAMASSNFSISRWLSISFELLTPMLLIAAIFAFSVDLWPAGIFDIPLAQIPLYEGIAAAGSAFASALGLMGLYLLAIEQISRRRNGSEMGRLNKDIARADRAI